MQPDQNYANHKRFHPLFHFMAAPILAINLIVRIVIAFRFYSMMAVWEVLVAFALLAGVFLARYYGLRNQDRIIRLEERLRLERLLPDDLRARVGDLRTSQLIGLRFCSDAELPDACRAVLAGDGPTLDAIKQRVKSWRPDYHRV